MKHLVGLSLVPDIGNYHRTSSIHKALTGSAQVNQYIYGKILSHQNIARIVALTHSLSHSSPASQ